jgi:short-subunit dehydrogenase
MDEKTGAGMTAEQCADRMLKAVERNKAEVLIGRYEILAAYIKRLSPALLRRIVRRAAVT